MNGEMVIFDQLLQFGVAGLMGVLWVWERMHSRKREQQLSETHDRLLHREEQLEVMIKLVQHNTRAMVEVERTQTRVCKVLDRLCHQLEEYQDDAA